MTRLRARWQGRNSKQTTPATNRKLNEEQGLAFCLYLDHLDDIGTSARLLMVNRYAHTSSSTPPPVIGPHWTRRFLERNPQYFIRKQSTIKIDRKNAHHPKETSIGTSGIAKLAMILIFNRTTSTISRKPGDMALGQSLSPPTKQMIKSFVV